MFNFFTGEPPDYTQIGCSWGGERVTFLPPGLSPPAAEKEGLVFIFFLEKEEMPGARAGSNSEKEWVLTQRQCLVISLKEKHVWGPDCGV